MDECAIPERNECDPNALYANTDGSYLCGCLGGVRVMEGTVLVIKIHQIFSLARDWSKQVTSANILQLKLGNIQDYNPSNIFARARLV